MIFNICFLVKTAMDLLFLDFHFWPPLLLSLLFYFFTVFSHSICSDKSFAQQDGSNRYCNICDQPQVLRAKHCDICQRCVHKYDHHCKLMEVCIGEFNHKYYLSFLVLFVVSQLIVDCQALKVIGDEVSLDQKGIEHRTWKYYVLCLQLCVYGLGLVGMCIFLVVRHLRLVAQNSTTWEENRRNDITYMRNVPSETRYPFSKGVLSNFKKAFTANRSNPTLWRLPLYR